MDDFLTATIIPVSTVIIAAGTLAGFMYQIGRWINQKAEAKAIALKKYQEDTAASLKIHSEEIERKFGDKIDKVDDKLMSMLEGLSSRSDLVNGNIANIRNDIGDLQEDIIDLYSSDDVNDSPQMDFGAGRDGLSARKNRKRHDLERRQKRRRIEEDRIGQQEKVYKDRAARNADIDRLRNRS